MEVLITIAAIGTDATAFDLYSDVDGYTSAFDTAVSRNDLLLGYTTALVPNTATIIRVQSVGVCTNFLDITIDPVITTTTTTTLAFYVFYVSHQSGLSSCESGVAADSTQVSADKSPYNLQIGDKIYADASGSGPGFPGAGTWYNVTTTLGFGIDANGIITDIDECSVPI